MQFDHVAVPSSDIAASVEWYRRHFSANVLYQDDTWAIMDLCGAKLALVSPRQHPPHVAIRASDEELARAAEKAGITIDQHRDGTRGVYLRDPFGNVVEMIWYPPAERPAATR